MAAPSLKGPYPLNSDSVSLTVTGNTAGAYIVGSNRLGRFDPLYVGRSETDLVQQLLKHIGNYASFSYAYASSPRVAYQMECEMYHAWKPRDNFAHPAKPGDSNWQCPICRQ
jgi:hypothetical protein